MSEQKIKDLIIAPHVDDEVLGCGGILNKDSFVYYCSIDESLVAPDPIHRISVEDRQSEIKDVSDFLGFKWRCNFATKVNHLKEIELIKIFEDLINELKPERIFIPFPSYNQDHRAVYNAAKIALRPHDKNFFVEKVLIYEQPHMVLWEEKPFRVNYFVPIDIKHKIKANNLHKSQVRSMRSDELIKAIAKIRGTQINKKYAEAFFIERWK